MAASFEAANPVNGRLGFSTLATETPARNQVLRVAGARLISTRLKEKDTK